MFKVIIRKDSSIISEEKFKTEAEVQNWINFNIARYGVEIQSEVVDISAKAARKETLKAIDFTKVTTVAQLKEIVKTLVAEIAE